MDNKEKDNNEININIFDIIFNIDRRPINNNQEPFFAKTHKIDKGNKCKRLSSYKFDEQTLNTLLNEREKK